MSAPWLSVIMPTYNGAAYIDAAIGSVVTQGDSDIELIIVDDGSDDESLDIARAYADRLSVSIIEAGRIANWVRATNIGMQAARGKYLCWLHNDDAWLPGRLAEMRRATHDVPNATLYASSCRYIDQRGRRVGLLRAPLPADRALPPHLVLPKLLIQNFFSPPALLFQKRHAEVVGWMDDALWYVADWDFGLKLAALGATVYHDVPLALYRVHPASLTTRRANRIDELRRMFQIVLDRHLPATDGAIALCAADVEAARFSADVNVTLAAIASGAGGPSRAFLGRCLTLPPTCWPRYFQCSRIVERIVSRLRVGLTG
ncbi:MAG TPA: glycosyltransferase [Pirellulales bacterium]|nr:glycosyltransferase [Pirellulales bacterium]